MSEQPGGDYQSAVTDAVGSTGGYTNDESDYQQAVDKATS